MSDTNEQPSQNNLDHQAAHKIIEGAIADAFQHIAAEIAQDALNFVARIKAHEDYGNRPNLGPGHVTRTDHRGDPYSVYSPTEQS